MKPQRLLIYMSCSHCGRTGDTGLNLEEVRESHDQRAPTEPCREILVGCKDCRTHIRVFIPESLLIAGKQLSTDKIDGIKTTIYML